MCNIQHEATRIDDITKTKQMAYKCYATYWTVWTTTSIIFHSGGKRNKDRLYRMVTFVIDRLGYSKPGAWAPQFPLTDSLIMASPDNDVSMFWRFVNGTDHLHKQLVNLQTAHILRTVARYSLHILCAIFIVLHQLPHGSYRNFTNITFSWEWLDQLPSHRYRHFRA